MCRTINALRKNRKNFQRHRTWAKSLAGRVLHNITARDAFGGLGRLKAAHRFTKEILGGWRNQRRNPSAGCRRR